MLLYRGRLEPCVVEDFLNAGYSEKQRLDIVLAISGKLCQITPIIFIKSNFIQKGCKDFDDESVGIETIERIVANYQPAKRPFGASR